jgi:hypothetical protein
LLKIPANPTVAWTQVKDWITEPEQANQFPVSVVIDKKPKTPTVAS